MKVLCVIFAFCVAASYCARLPGDNSGQSDAYGVQGGFGGSVELGRSGAQAQFGSQQGFGQSANGFARSSSGNSGLSRSYLPPSGGDDYSQGY